ncbi:MAG TPA: helix-turn-helix domain-containing protein [Actinophytocola sp.]|uniref:ArsR/SmtB family transcription factor n=1 Tax=Actinophytocola sp. TaxID=1872138 RepID=UPI002DBA5220|nr:helix-turn-helix domain-containing protein [Actinophytocola sp.]HEU5474843.1 helix-turn-helix domain-containing protein [Actinophytocola sp.]
MEHVALAEVAAVLAEPARAAMCLALIDGRAWTVGELARVAGIAPSTGSEHVGRLAAAGFVQSVRQGRHRYVRIADPRVAELIERLSGQTGPPPPAGLRASLRARRLAVARTCYDHLAGRLGVRLREGMLRLGLIDTSSGLTITAAGRRTLDRLGVAEPAPNGRPLLRDCLDWTERREHLAGAIPAALLNRAVAAGWLDRAPDRSVRIRPAGSQPLAALGVDVPQLQGGDAALERSG